MADLRRWIVWLRWGARLLGLLSLIYLFVYLFVAAGDNTSQPAMNEVNILFALPLMAALAYAVAWRRETWGGMALSLIALALGGLTFTFANRNHFGASLRVSLPLLAAGGLFLACGRYSADSSGRLEDG